MEDDDDFSELYGDLEVCVQAGIRAAPPILESQQTGEKPVPSIGEGANGERTEADGTGDVEIELNGVDSRAGCSGLVSGGGAECRDAGKGSADAPVRRPLVKFAGSSIKGKHVTNAINCHRNTSSTSQTDGRHDWGINSMNQVVSPGIPSMMNNGTDSLISQNKAMFDLGIESFEINPWRKSGAHNSGFLNFDLDEESWQRYYGTQSRGRGIQVEYGNGERLPSMNVRRTRNRHSDAIQVKVDCSEKDMSPPNNTDVEHADSLYALERNGNFDGAVDSSMKLGVLSCGQASMKNAETINSDELSGHRSKQTREGSYGYLTGVASLPEASSCDQIIHTLSSHNLGDGSDTAVDKLEGSDSPNELSSGQRYPHQVSSNMDDRFLHVSISRGTTKDVSVENSFEHHSHENQYKRSGKVSHGAIRKASLHNSHDSRHVQKKYSKQKNYLEKDMKEGDRVHKLYGRRSNFSSGIKRGLSFSPSHKYSRDNVTRCSSSRNSERQTHPKNYYNRSRGKRSYSPARRSSHCNSSMHLQCRSTDRGAHERRSNYIEDQSNTSFGRARDSSYKRKYKPDHDIRMRMNHKDISFKHRRTIVESHQSDVRFSSKERIDLDVCKKSVNGSRDECDVIVPNSIFSSSSRSEHDTRLEKNDGCRSVVYSGPFRPHQHEMCDFSISPNHTNGVQKLKEDCGPTSSDMACKTSSDKESLSNRRELGHQFDDDHVYKGDFLSDIHLPMELNFPSPASIVKHHEEENVYSPEVSDSGRYSRYNVSHEGSILDETCSFRDSCYLDSYINEKTGNSVSGEQNNSMSWDKDGGTYSSDQKGKDSADGSLQIKPRLASAVYRVNLEEVQSPGNWNVDSVPMNSSDERAEAYESLSYIHETNKVQLGKYAFLLSSDHELEEGELMEKPEKMCYDSNNNVKTQTIVVEQHNLVEQIEKHGDTNASKIVKELEDDLMREREDKMKMCEERFKNSFTVKNYRGYEKSIQSTTYGLRETIKHRPPRKRRCGDD